ncbi:MAG: hypothetical protein F9K09_01395 [Flavobacteriales bacterium]|nr:MAG: hypothetical protein F9K09_01395 [Flavobacteriales bacterium]
MIQRIKYSGLTMMFLLSLSISFAQKMKELTHREISEHYTDSSIKASILLENKKVRLKNTIDYYWYYNNNIKFNQGDYKGKLLDGDYQVITKNGNLIRKGQFKTGYKVGVWKDWNTKGELLLVQQWNNGQKNGSCQKYFDGKLIEEGNYNNNKLNGSYKKFNNDTLIEKGIYKNDLLHGKQVVYQNDTIYSITRYKKGKEVIKKEKKPKADKTEDGTTNEKDSTLKKWWKFWEKKKENEVIKDEKPTLQDGEKTKDKKVSTKKTTDKNTTTEEKKKLKTSTVKKTPSKPEEKQKNKQKKKKDD